MRYTVSATLAMAALACGSDPEAISDTGVFEVCAEVRETAQLVPVNLLLTVDRSGSMNDGKPIPKWSAVTRAVRSFVENPAAEQLNVGLRVWPDDEGCNKDDCDAAVCSEPQVPVGSLADPDQRDALLAELESGDPRGNTPMSAALEGAASWARRVQDVVPDEQVTVALVTDGIPNGCDESIDRIAQTAAGAFASGIPMFVMGIEGSRESDVDAIAAAGGTDEAYLVGTSVAETALLEALLAIQGEVLSCIYDFPEGAELDPDRIRVEVERDGELVLLERVDGDLGCLGNDLAWFLSDDGRRITLCDATCDAVRDTLQAQIDIEIGCVCVVDDDCPENERCEDNLCQPDPEGERQPEGRVQGGAGKCNHAPTVPAAWVGLLLLLGLGRRGGT